MRHRHKGRKLSRIKKQREALLKSLMTSLILHKKIKTTEAKAKEIKPLMEKIIHFVLSACEKGEKKMFVKRKLSVSLPPVAIVKLMEIYWQENSPRKTGCVRLAKLGQRRSDGARMSIIEIK